MLSSGLKLIRERTPPWRGAVGRVRAGLTAAVRGPVAGDRFAEHHARIWHTPGPRWFAEGDPIWTVHSDIAMLIGGIRALLLQSLHPVAMLGVTDHSDFRDDPLGRLQRTSHFITVTTFGTVSDAERSIAKVRGIHRRVRGVVPDSVPSAEPGRAYRADDPDLLLWVHAAEIDSFLSAHRAFGATPLDRAGYDRYVAQTCVVAERLGVVDPPDSVDRLDAVIASYRPVLTRGPGSDDVVDLLLRRPPIVGPAGPGYRLLAAGAVSLLPPWARSQLGLPPRDRLPARTAARTLTRILRWGLAGDTAV
ncbi:oxygenase MpaB family protein [Microlunatus speluncae]|uniref:oxygenase MpaB family protein n=1 Tax=Microlunatus speluncae TaxID=2594267 RepID=UPI0012663298|nr:oxygenase MpaB family protein [Microlunatus speluncae]